MISTHNFRPKTSRQHLQPSSYPTPHDTDELQEPPSLSSSPISQYSVVPHTGPDSRSPFSAPSSLPSFAIPRSVETTDVALNLGEHSELMNTANWNSSGRQLLPTYTSSRAAHNRDDSLSSLGSVGPRSPYNTNAAHPRIALADASHETLHGVPDISQDGGLWDSNYTFLKQPTLGQATDHFYQGLADGSLDNHEGHGLSSMPSGMAQRHHGERRGVAPSVDFSRVLSRHGADSVASSTIGGDSPATPALGESAEDRRRTEGLHEATPKLERTLTDVVHDGLYIPNLAVTSSSPPQQDFSPSTPFSRALEAANSQHLNVDQSPTSPFRHGSPLAPAPNRNFGIAPQYNTAAAQQQVELHHNGHRDTPVKADQAATPQTISPKDSILEFDEADGDNHFTLFSPQAPGSFSGPGHLMHGATPRATAQSGSGQLQQFMRQQPATAMRVPQSYPFIAAPQPSEDAGRQLVPAPGPSREATGAVPAAAAGSIDDGKTYSCTYHGCKLRFDTQKELQAHKKEGHRPTGSARRGERGPNQQTQQGPHTCVRVNPSTGKICGSSFSRPYDLTRHEDTIHNQRKKKLRCDVCSEEKLFSRRDALTRHFKVCHEDLYPQRFGKGRRRGART